jgi:Fe-S cluster biogenesis protein NfuA/nitrite reductase/ring-hydroxylating ferredoxin subunit
MDDRQARECVARIEALLEEVEGLPAAVELVQGLLDLYGEGLGRIVASDPTLVARLDGDEVVTHLLLLHGLHPVPLEERVVGALDEVRPYLASHGGGVELLGVEEGVVRLRLQGSCDGCPSSTATLKLAIEDAIHKAAPDVERIEAEGAQPPAPPPLIQLGTAPGLIQLEVSDTLRPEPDGAAWEVAGVLAELPAETPVAHAVAGEPLLFVRLGKAAYAYRPACPACTAALADGALDGAVLACAACGHAYDVRHAGRCVDDDGLHLEPVPLLVGGDGMVRVALGAPA